MRADITPTSDSRVVLNLPDAEPEKKFAAWEKWLPPAAFIGFSGFVVAGQLTDSLQTIPIIKLILQFLAGAVGALAATQTRLFRHGTGQ